MTHPPADAPIIRADPPHRTRVLVWLGATVVAGASVLGLGVPWLVRELEAAVATGQVSNRAVCIGFLAFVAAIGLSVIAIGVRTARLGSRAVAVGQFPLPDTRVLRDTRVLKGRPAVIMGRVEQVLGVLLVFFATLLVALCAYGVSYFL